MLITKLTHACLLVEGDQANVLFDPGNYSWASGAIDVKTFPKLDYLAITHAHADHLDEGFIAAVKERFPNLKLAANQAVKNQLDKFALAPADSVLTEFSARHEDLPGGAPPPPNSGWHFERLSHPGDSLSFTETREILALPYVAPWGSTKQAVELAVKLKPKYVLPVHDWHLSPAARAWYGNLLTTVLAGAAITVLDPANGPIRL